MQAMGTENIYQMEEIEKNINMELFQLNAGSVWVWVLSKYTKTMLHDILPIF